MLLAASDCSTLQAREHIDTAASSQHLIFLQVRATVV